MSISDYLKYKMRSDRVLAEHLDTLAKKLKDNSITLATDLNRGLERVSWYSSCAFDKYNDVCQELKYEDRRMYSAIKQAYDREDVILDILMLYIDYLLKDFDEHKKTVIAKTVLGISLDILTNRAIKESVAFILAKSITSSFNFARVVRQRIQKHTPFFITMVAFYGKVQVAAMSARHLRDINPGFYWSLYAVKLEMLYFLVEPVLHSYMTIQAKKEADVIKIISELSNR